MDQEQLKRMQTGKGFVAALDQSGGSTPGALERYGVSPGLYHNEDEMFDQMHEMRVRIMTSPSFSSEYILGAILFAGTMRRQVKGLPSALYLWQEKGVVPFLKVDQGMEEARDGARLMKPIIGERELLDEAVGQGVFGTKMRSFIAEANRDGIRRNVDQQFEYAARIARKGLVPIVEPEVDIHCPDKEAAEDMLLEALAAALEGMPKDGKLLFKLTIPTKANLFDPLAKYPQVVRMLALSGGYTREEANRLLAQNHGMIASFSRALASDLRVSQTPAEFDAVLGDAIRSIYDASVS